MCADSLRTPSKWSCNCCIYAPATKRRTGSNCTIEVSRVDWDGSINTYANTKQQHNSYFLPHLTAQQLWVHNGWNFLLARTEYPTSMPIFHFGSFLLVLVGPPIMHTLPWVHSLDTNQGIPLLIGSRSRCCTYCLHSQSNQHTAYVAWLSTDSSHTVLSLIHI